MNLCPFVVQCSLNENRNCSRSRRTRAWIPPPGRWPRPIYLSTTFERDIEGTYSRGFMYSRNDNPNRKTLERGASMLEGGEAAAAFASGTGATMSILQAIISG